MHAIFISYRRDDSEGHSGRLRDALNRRFGDGSVFMDVVDIEAGRDFREVIEASCGVFLAVIGPSWLDAKDEAGLRRLDDPMDFVRLETAPALKRRIVLVPVLVHGARMPEAEQLPDDLKELTYRNAIGLTHAHWNSDLEVLIGALRPHLADVIQLSDFIFDGQGSLPDLVEGADPFNITGVWECNDGGIYYVRNLGREVWWFGHGVHPHQSFANVAYGQVEGEGDKRTLKLRWADVPAGTTNIYGRLVLLLSFSIQQNRVTHMSATESSGRFGGEHWTWSAKWSDHLRST
jgi:TIR domain